MLALLRLPQFPSRRRVGPGSAARSTCARRWPRSSTIAGIGRIGRLPDRDDRCLRQRFPDDEARALAIDNAATFYLAGHETTANAHELDPVPAGRPTGPAGGTGRRSASRAVGGSGRCRRARAAAAPVPRASRCGSIRRCRASTGRRSAGPDRRAGGRARRHRLDLALDAPSPPQAVGRSRRLRNRALRREGQAATAFNICRSVQAREPASAPSSRPPKR